MIIDNDTAGEAGKRSPRPRSSRRGDPAETIGARLVERRIALGLTQGHVADRVRFFNKNRKEWGVLSRSAYCMYETDDVTPDVDKLLALADALSCTPEWLTFGRGFTSFLQLMDLDPPTGSWVEAGRYLCEDSLVRDACDAELCTTCLFSAVDHTKSVNPGNYVFVAIGEQPGITAGEFVFRYEGAACNSIVTRPRMGPTYRLHRDGLSGFDLVNIDEVNVLGKVVGRLGQVR